MVLGGSVIDARDVEEEGGQHGGHTGHHAEARGTNRFEKFRQLPLLRSPSCLLGKHCRAVW